MKTKSQITLNMAKIMFDEGSFKTAKICALAAHYQAFYAGESETMDKAHHIIEMIQENADSDS